MESKQTGMSGQASKLMAVNELFYKMPAPLSVTVVTTNKKQYSTRNEYLPGQTVVFDLNCNSAVDAEKSFIKFTIQCTAGTPDINFGGSTALNVIREVRIMSKNGAELDRISNFNHWVRHYIRNCVPEDDFRTYSELWGFNLTTPNIAVNASQTFVFPLAFLSGIFRPHGKVKLPPQLLSGARMELVLEDTSTAVITPLGASGYKMLNPEISLSEHSLGDNALKVLAEESANNGLEITYDRVFVASESNGTVSQFNTQIKKAVSQCTSIIAEPKNTTLLNAPNFDSFLSVPGSTEFSKYQFRLASSYFPNQEVDDIREAWYYASKICDRHKMASFATYATYTGLGDFHVATQIKSDDEITSSGLPINNSASLAVNIETNVASTTPKTYFLYMTYTALARCFISQVSVKI